MSLWFDNYYRLLILSMLLTMVAFSCTKEKQELQSVQKKVPTYSVNELVSTLPELSANSIKSIQLPEFVVPYYLEPFPNGEYLVTTDRTEKAIHLFDESGNYLGEAGGEGRGPGEFNGGIKLHAGSDKHLYTYDLILRRITRFKVDFGGLSYVNSFSPSQESLTWLQNIYVTEWGNFGVYREKVDIGIGEEEFHLYKLNDEFNQLERLLTMPGNEKMPLEDRGPFTQYIDHMVGEQTLWDLNGEWFYFISSHSPAIHKYNLKTGESLTNVYFNLEEREITEKIRGQLMEYSANISSRFPSVKDAMEDVQVLPVFEEFMVYDNMLYLLLFNISENEQTEIIRINEKAEKAHYLNIPLKLKRIKAGMGSLYGIESTEDDFTSIKMMHLTEL